MNEWRDVEGFVGYRVSDCGDVVSFRNRAGGLKAVGRVLKHDVSGTCGHHRVTLTTPDGRLERVQVHRLVMRAFGPARPPGRQ